MTKCSIKPCGNDAVVKGLCRKHYMRLRRNGDATATKTPGPKPKADFIEELARAMISNRSSPRTLARSRRASTLLLSISPEIRRYIKTLTGPRGVNVSRLLRLAEDEALRQLAKDPGFDSSIVPDPDLLLLDHPDYRQARAGYLSSVLKIIRAKRKRGDASSRSSSRRRERRPIRISRRVNNR
jgi:hypothetical protein